MRDTSNYEGEELGRENLAITEEIVIPGVFIIAFIVVIFYRRWRRGLKRFCDNKAFEIIKH